MYKQILVVLMVIGSASASGNNTGQQEGYLCQPIADFSTAAETDRWSAQNDDVMGGRSRGGPGFENGHLVFSGYTNMDGGGFSSIRARHARDAFAQADAVRLTLKSDGRDYQLSFRTGQRDGWQRRYAFRTTIPASPVGEWSTIVVPLDQMSASIWGRKKNVDFDKTRVSEYGLFIYDGITGPFSLAVKSLEVCSKATLI